MADKTKHSNDEIFELLSAMVVDIEELKKNSSKATFQPNSEIESLKCFEKELMWQRKSVEGFPYIMRKCFQDWKNYQERKDEEWYDLMEDFAKQTNENNAIYTRHKEEIKKTLIHIKSLIESKNKEYSSKETMEKYPYEEPLIIPKNLKGWLKFLFYDCPKYSFSKPNRRKFLSQLGRTIKLFISVVVIVLLFLLANENHHLRIENAYIHKLESIILTHNQFQD